MMASLSKPDTGESTVRASFIKGKYTWAMARRRVFGKQRWVMYIIKGDECLAKIAYHPAARQLAVHPATALTTPTLKFIEKYLNPRTFNKCAQFWARRERQEL